MQMMHKGRPLVSDSLELSREQWENAWEALCVAYDTAKEEEDTQRFRNWLQTLMGLCDSMKATSSALSSAVGFETRGK